MVANIIQFIFGCLVVPAAAAFQLPSLAIQTRVLGIVRPTSLQELCCSLVVFDKDGTLGNDKASLRIWARHMFDKLAPITSNLEPFQKRIGWDACTEDLVPSAPLAAGTWANAIQDVYDFASMHDDTITFEAVQSWHDELGDLHATDPPLIDNLRHVFVELQQQLNCTIAVCTSDERLATNTALRHWGIDDLVQYSVCADEVSTPKPHPEALLKLSGLANVPPEKCVMVGDTTADARAAQSACFGLCIGVLTGSGNQEQLLANGAHVVLPNVGHVLGHLRKLKESDQEHN